MKNGRIRSASCIACVNVRLRRTRLSKNSSCDTPDFWKSSLFVTMPIDFTPWRSGICHDQAWLRPMK